MQFRVDQKSTDPILELQQLAKTMPQPVSRWLEQIAEYSWRSVLKSAIVSLEVEWNEKVVKKYKLYIKDRYPFVSQSQQEVPLSEFSRFFGPNGTIDSFYETNLKPFIESDLRHITGENSSLIRPDVVEQLELAKRIKETFFNSDNDGIGVHFSIEPLSISSNKRRSVLNLDGQIVDYTHGLRKKTHVVWPNSMSNNVESKLTLVSVAEKSPRSLVFKGPWAQIKLLTSGKISNIKAGSFDVRYDIHEGYATYRVYIDESDNPFSWDILRKFNIPETLYE
ncbi:type VI secretion IcmF C-terminal domain-containing protein [Gallibacterium anatis]|uniref:type VI secretion IcmF C-terminal domain-containing protein n=1 Tax=Gallibacterium anatis TaxID=750 RepID=UPI001E3354D5|nr:type VI secretion IcmF C-terminal domain-containing protein [Gallibacterium anatis]